MILRHPSNLSPRHPDGATHRSGPGDRYSGREHLSRTSTDRTSKTDPGEHVSHSVASAARTRTEPRFVQRSPMRTIVIGTIGSLLMMVGSFGIGWLAPISRLRQDPVIIALRYTDGAVVACIVMTALGAMALTREWLRLSQKIAHWGRPAKKWVTLAILCWVTPMLFSFPLFSRDVYSYYAQGRVYESGLNPYESGVSSVNNFFQSGADPLWSQSPPPYGAVFLWIEGLVVRVAGTSPDVAFYLFRLVALIGVALIAIFLPKLARMHGINPVRACWLCLANPMFLVHFVISAHNDALMIGLMMAGVWVSARWRTTAGGIGGITLVTLAIAVKPIAIITLPFIGLLWAGRGASWPRRILFWVLTLAVCLAQLWIMGRMNGFGFDWINGLKTTGGVWIWYAPVGALSFLGKVLVDSLGGPGGDVQSAIQKIGQLLGMLGAGIMALIGRDQTIIRRLTLALAFVVMFNPMIQAWYVVWLIPFFAATGIRADWHVDFYFLTTLFFMLWAVSDQLDVFPYLDLDLNMGRLVAIVVALVYAVYLMFLDPSTRRVFRRRHRGTAVV